TIATPVSKKQNTASSTFNVFRLAEEIKFEFPISIYDLEFKGQYYASLLEPYLSNINSNEPLALPFNIDRIYRKFFIKLIKARNLIKVIADCNALNIFYPTMFIEIPYRHIIEANNFAVENITDGHLTELINSNPNWLSDKRLGQYFISALLS